MLPPSDLEPGANLDADSGMRDSAHDRVRPPPARFLVDAPTAAALLAISERAFHSLRKRSDFPKDATIILGPRCVRFRLDAVLAFAMSLVSPTPRSEPSQLRRRREELSE
jgi:predicted DNA-binding transcriptional regulator AlpA